MATRQMRNHPVTRTSLKRDPAVWLKSLVSLSQIPSIDDATRSPLTIHSCNGHANEGFLPHPSL